MFFNGFFTFFQAFSTFFESLRSSFGDTRGSRGPQEGGTRGASRLSRQGEVVELRRAPGACERKAFPIKMSSNELKNRENLAKISSKLVENRRKSTEIVGKTVVSPPFRSLFHAFRGPEGVRNAPVSRLLEAEKVPLRCRETSGSSSVASSRSNWSRLKKLSPKEAEKRRKQVKNEVKTCSKRYQKHPKRTKITRNNNIKQHSKALNRIKSIK